MKLTRLQFNTRTWLQLGLLPAVAAVTIASCWSIYATLDRQILRNFELKLAAVSTTTAAFVDPADHLWLMEQPDLQGLAYSPDDVIYGLDSSRHVLMRIRAANGVAEDRVVPVPPGLHDLAYHQPSRQLIALETLSGQVFTLDPDTGTATPHLSAGPTARGLLTDDAGEILIVADHLLRIDFAAQKAVPVSTRRLPPVVAAEFDTDRRIIWAIDEQRRILQINPATGAATSSATVAADVALPGSLTYDSRRHILLGAGRSIVRVETETGRIVPAHFVAAFGKELTLRYRNYALPMRQLMDRLELSFVYTQTVTDRTQIRYGIDGTHGERHSPLQSEDKLPESDVAGIQELMRSGARYVSPVQPWTKWGRLMSAFAPILDDSGRPVAMTGTDVDVSIIERETRTALLGVLFLGTTVLLIASAVSLAFSRRLRQPLNEISTAALAVAAGQLAQRSQVTAPLELRALGDAFNRFADTVQGELRDLQSSVRDLLRRRDRYELAHRLAQPYRPAAVLKHVTGITLRGTDDGAVDTAHGAVPVGRKIVLWLAPNPGDPLAAARARSDLALRFAARWTHGDPTPATGSPAGVSLAVLIDPDARTVRPLGGSGPATLTPSSAGTLVIQDAQLTVTFTGFLLLPPHP